MLNTLIIGNKITEARKSKNLSQAQLAQLLSISSQAVGKWERGESMPDIITFNRMAEVFGVDLNYFSERFPSEPIKESAEYPPIESILQPQEKSVKKLSWNISMGNWVDADFSGLKNLHEKFSSSNLQKCLFIDSDLSGLLLKSNNVESCDFTKSNIGNSRIQYSNVVNSRFLNCSLQETLFSGSHMKGCDFTDADFTGAVIKSSSFQKNKITGAIWDRTTFSGSQFTDIIFESTIQNCSFQDCAFSRVTLQGVTLLDTFIKNSNLKKVKFLDCKADKITYAFLKNGKADLSGVTLIVT